MRHRIGALVVGGGAVGLAACRSLLARNAGEKQGNVLLVEALGSFGQEISSRNSQVVHAGLYYPKDSLKTRLCIRGKNLLYKYCLKNNISHSRIGKWVVSPNMAQQEEIEKLFYHAKSLDIPVELLSSEKAAKLEPLIRSKGDVLVSPTTGILDAHEYMSALENEIKSLGGDIAYHSRVTSCHFEPSTCTYITTISCKLPDGSSQQLKVESDILVNAAGLYAHEISDWVRASKCKTTGDPFAPTTIHYCKGHYFSLKKSTGIVGRLIYPVPDKMVTSLGFHLTLDLGNNIRFGPDVYFQDSATDYSFRSDTQAHIAEAVRSINQYMPSVRAKDIVPDYTGIRPKLAAPGEKAVDFKIRVQDGFVDLVGIESPGLTSSLAIGEYIFDQLGFSS